MTEEQFNFKIKEYIDRSRFWSEKALTQLGFSINLMTTIGIGIFSFLISSKEKFLLNPIFSTIDKCWSQVIFNISFILIFFSILLGFVSILARLNDFRISRHLSLIRKKYLSKMKNENGFIKTDNNRIRKPRLINSFFKNILGNTKFISEDDLNSREILQAKFIDLQNQATVLGFITWRSHKLQILFLVLSLLFIALIIVS